MPEEVAYLVRWFWMIGRGRTGTGYGPNPISWAEVEAWARVTGIQPLLWEISALLELDAAWLKHIGDRLKRRRDGEEEPVGVLTPDVIAGFGRR